MSRSLSALPVVLLLSAASAAAQDVSPGTRQRATCAPVGVGRPSGAPRVLAAAGTHGRTMFSNREQISVSGAVAAGQRYFVRRPMTFNGAPQAEHTVGTVTIVEVSEAGATARIDVSCDGVAVGDHLEPFVELNLPAGADRTDASGRLDAETAMRVSYGLDGHELAGNREFMLADEGAGDGVVAGTRFAVFHTHRRDADHDRPFAEAIVVSVFPGSSLLRITEARDAVEKGDRLVLRVANAVAAPAPVVVDEPAIASAADGANGSSAEANNTSESDRSFAFDDLYFDFNKQTLKKEATALLDRAIVVLNENPSLRVSVEGYTCDIGTAEFNLALGERRAKEVRKYLVAHGVDAGRLTIVSLGEENPKYDNTNKDTRKLNRRAVLVVNVTGN